MEGRTGQWNNYSRRWESSHPTPPPPSDQSTPQPEMARADIGEGGSKVDPPIRGESIDNFEQTLRDIDAALNEIPIFSKPISDKVKESEKERRKDVGNANLLEIPRNIHADPPCRVLGDVSNNTPVTASKGKSLVSTWKKLARAQGGKTSPMVT